MNGLGIDLGTANTRVVVAGRGVVASLPSFVAMDPDSQAIIAIGQEARDIFERAPGRVLAVLPIRSGAVADRRAATSLLSRLIAQAIGPRPLIHPLVFLSVPAVANGVERRAAIDAALTAGARRVRVVESPPLVALGAGLDPDAPRASLVVDVGAGTTDIAVVSMGGMISARTVTVAGLAFDDAIARQVRSASRVRIGHRVAERVKVAVGTVARGIDRGPMAITGRDLVTGLPRAVEVGSETVRTALEEPVRAIVRAVRYVLEEIPPEAAADVAGTGLLLAGGGSLVAGFDQVLREGLDLPVTRAVDPLEAVASGLERLLQRWPEFHRAARATPPGGL